VKKKIKLTLLLLFFPFASLFASLPEDSLPEDPPAASEEISQIADEMMSIADKLDLQQNLLDSLTKDLEGYRQDFPKLQETLDQMQVTYDSLRSDYKIQQFELKVWKTRSITFGIGLGITTIIATVVIINSF